jgi:hypothetical protein
MTSASAAALADMEDRSEKQWLLQQPNRNFIDNYIIGGVNRSLFWCVADLCDKRVIRLISYEQWRARLCRAGMSEVVGALHIRLTTGSPSRPPISVMQFLPTDSPEAPLF